MLFIFSRWLTLDLTCSSTAGSLTTCWVVSDLYVKVKFEREWDILDPVRLLCLEGLALDPFCHFSSVLRASVTSAILESVIFL